MPPFLFALALAREEPNLTGLLVNSAVKEAGALVRFASKCMVMARA